MNITMNKFFLLIFLLAIGEVFSQSDYRSGYIVKNNNDTLQGYLKYRADKANSKKCIFKEDLEAEKKAFLPDEIQAFRFTDSNYFVSKNVNTMQGEETLFLEYLIDGIVDIYFYRDEIKGH